ncbi:putative FAD-dependent monooxygenase Dbabp [[Candida] jaroonii]|uniref:FAD-dependent monooxygenase Dbabp n=1 Tax=[Candida] jaroonii TaxID=467808 RepID=A0ACA9Y7A7_9ASCO|nr:putative FAD-dependent monooxygenase Dbabp [[Candida] jaroonii]
MSKEEFKVIISGAGLIGLLIAQALKARNVDYVIFDRDESVQQREQHGWAITLHWALQSFKDLLNPQLVEKIYQAQVLPNFHEKDTGNFKYINAHTTESIVSIPPSKRLRVRREQIRRILLEGIDVDWGCKLVSIDSDDENVTVKCGNGKEFRGSVLIGCEGSQSITRKLVCGEDLGTPYQLPIRFVGSKVRLSKDEVAEIAEKFDPLLFQGTTPSNTFFWFSMLSTPEYSGDGYYAQVNVSFPADDNEPFNTKEEMAAAIMRHSEDLAPELKKLSDRCVEDWDTLQQIRLVDWPAVEWDNANGKVLLCGDSAHAMTMFRGEAANHGITDVKDLMFELDKFLNEGKPWDTAANDYCQTIKARAAPAVMLSRQACLDAHDFTKIKPNSDSPLLSLRKNTK